jgi:geranylgeranyl diphosphate synthase, type I
VIVPSVLSDAREIVAPAMEEALSRLSPEIRRVIDYHMGWRDADGRPVQRRGSKSVRPALALLSAEAGGADPAAAIPGALAVEFMNNWAFLIDDVMDRDEFRRQRSTAWVVFGDGRAICAGTALLTLSQQVLAEASAPGSVAALALALDTSARMLAGQTLDLTFENRLDFTVDESMMMTLSKTASLMRCATSIGAVLTGASAESVAALTEFGQCVGVAFQARDDLLGIWGRPAQTGGRPRGFDVRARKGTPPIAVALNAGGTASEELREILAWPTLNDDDVDRCAALIEACGGGSWTEALAREKVAQGLAAIDDLDCADDVRARLADVAMMGLPDDVLS